MAFTVKRNGGHKDTNTDKSSPCHSRTHRPKETKDNTMEIDSEMNDQSPVEEPMKGSQLGNEVGWYSLHDDQNGWNVMLLPTPSDSWNQIPLKLRQSVVLPDQPLDTLQALLQEWNLATDPVILVEEWKDLVEKNITKHSGKKTRPLIRFALAVAKCLPTDLSHVREVQEGWDVGTTILNAVWIASMSVFGHPQIAWIWTPEDMLPEPSDQGNKWMKWEHPSFPTNPIQSSEELFKEGSEGVHDPIQSCKRDLQFQDTATPNQWEEAVNQATVATKRNPAQDRLLALALRLAKSDPSILPGWKDGNLPPSMIGCLWKGAISVLGNLQPPIVNVMHPFSTPTKQASKKTQFKPISLLRKDKGEKDLPNHFKQIQSKTSRALNLQAQSVQGNQNFIVRSTNPPPSAKKEPKKSAFKTNSFLQVILPVFVGDVSDYSSAQKLVLSQLKTLWAALLACEPYGTAILPWEAEKRASPLKSASSIPQTKSGIEKYVEVLKLAWSPSTSPGTTVRFILGHSKAINEFINHKLVIEKLESLGIDKFGLDAIQSRERATVGYLAGPIIERHTIEDLKQILIQKDIFKANKVEQIDIEVDLIKTHRQRMTQEETRVRALQIVVPAVKKAVARSCFQRTFPSNPRADYPLGLQFRFVPDITDKDMAVPPKARGIAERLRSRQADFLKRCQTRDYDHIKNLHSSLASAPFVILSRVLMGMKSRDIHNRYLFIAVEQAYYGDPVRFTYLSEMADEVDSILPVLPLILAGLLGAEAKEWFKESASMGTEGFKYDEEKRAVVPDGNNVLSVLDQQGRFENLEDEWSENQDEQDNEGFIIEFGEFDTCDNQEARKRILHDDSASVGTMGLALTPGFIDPDNPVPLSPAQVSTPNSSITYTTGPTTEEDMIERLLKDPELLKKLDIARLEKPVPQERDGEK